MTSGGLCFLGVNCTLPPVSFSLSHEDPFMNDLKYEKKSSEVDCQMIQRNLGLSPQERIENHQAALNFVIELKSTGQNYYAKSQRTSQKDPGCKN